jgi:hypothetical protein
VPSDLFQVNNTNADPRVGTMEVFLKPDGIAALPKTTGAAL